MLEAPKRSLVLALAGRLSHAAQATFSAVCLRLSAGKAARRLKAPNTEGAGWVLGPSPEVSFL